MDVTSVPAHWRPSIADAVHRLVERDFEGLNGAGALDPVHASDPAQIAYWSDRYPGTLVDLPEAAWAVVDRVPMPDRPDTWCVDVPLWTAEEGRSDLILQAYVVDDGDSVRVILYDLHVM